MLRPALLTGKLIRLLRPGKPCRAAGAAALVLCPNLYSRLSVEGKILLITGSDGKSSVAAMAVHMLRAAGQRVVTNCELSGRSEGTATALVAAADLRGRIACDWLVLEADGRTSDSLLSLGRPEILLVTDLFPHHGPLSCRRASLLSLVDRAVGSDTRLILNAMEPGLSGLQPALSRVFFGSAALPELPTKCRNVVSAGALCPSCGQALTYSFVFHHHLGGWYCPACGAASPRTEYLLSSLTAESCTVSGADFPLQPAAPYHGLNLTAAVALVCEALHITPAEAHSLYDGFRLPEAFYREVVLGGRRHVALLCRNGNPISFDRGLEYVAAHPETKTVLIHTDRSRLPIGSDISWLYDTTFELLRGAAETVVCTGESRLDCAARLRYAGLQRENILLCPEENQLRAMLGATRGSLYVLAEPDAAARIFRVLQKGGRP